MTNTTYLIDYTLIFKAKKPESKQIRVKKAMSDLHAKIKLEDYLKLKYPDFDRLEVQKCEPDMMYEFLNGFR